MAEAEAITDAWAIRIERSGMAEAMRRYYEGDDELDGKEGFMYCHIQWNLLLITRSLIVKWS